MPLALFDLDHTLLTQDSDFLWGQFLVQQGHVDAEFYARENLRFYQDYQAGTLDIHAYAAFVLAPLQRHPAETVAAWRARFIAEKIEPVIAPLAPALLERHRAAGAQLVITTATNRFITEPIAERLGVDALIATDPEQIDGRYTGRIAGTPNFQAGKVHRLEQWLAAQPGPVGPITFYSDSRNDLPLLERVDHPVAVDPDPVLRDIATARGWPVISLRGAPPRLA